MWRSTCVWHFSFAKLRIVARETHTHTHTQTNKHATRARAHTHTHTHTQYSNAGMRVCHARCTLFRLSLTAFPLCGTFDVSLLHLPMSLTAYCSLGQSWPHHIQHTAFRTEQRSHIVFRFINISQMCFSQDVVLF